MKQIKLRLDVLVIYLETKGIITLPKSKAYWSKWIRSKNEASPDQQNQDIQREKNWTEVVNAVQDQIEQFITDLSSNNPSIQKMFLEQICWDNRGYNGSDVKTYPLICKQRHYFDANKVYQYLVQNDKSGKTLFGQYKDPLLTEFSSFLDAYKSDGVHLLQSISLLEQSLYNDLPSLQNNVKYLDKKLKSLNRRLNIQEMECAEKEKLWTIECQSWGIKDVTSLQDIDQKIDWLISHKLSSLCQELELELQRTNKEKGSNIIETSILYYQEFTSNLQTLTRTGKVSDENMSTLRQVLKSKGSIDDIMTSTILRSKLCEELNELKYFFIHRQLEATGAHSSHSFIPTTPSKEIDELKHREFKIQSILEKLQSGHIPLLSKLAQDEDYRKFVTESIKLKYNNILNMRQNISQDKMEKPSIHQQLKVAKYILDRCNERVGDLRLKLENELKSYLDVTNGCEVCVVTSI